MSRLAQQHRLLIRWSDPRRDWSSHQSLRGPSDGRADVPREHAACRVEPHVAVILRALAQRGECGLFTLLLAAFRLLLNRWSDPDAPATAFTSAHLPTNGNGAAPSMPIGNGGAGADPGFDEWLACLRSAGAGMYEPEPDPSDGLPKEAVAPDGEIHAVGHFQALFILHEPGSPDAADSPGPYEAPYCDLILCVREAADGLLATCEYNRDLFERAVVERMLAGYVRLLAAIAADPSTRISMLPVISDEEWQRQVVEWNRTEAAYPKDQTVLDLFEEQVARTPQAIALSHGGSNVTYAELDERAAQLGGELRRLGVGPEQLVGVCLPRSIEMVVGLLGVWKAGGAYVPLDPSYPRERIALMLEDAQVGVLLTQKQFLSTLPAPAARVVLLDADWTPTETAGAEGSLPARSSRQLAYVIYTSGSTGRPKGVMLEHRSAVAFLSWCRSFFAPGELSNILAATSICFDLSIFELFAPLITGGRAIVVENALALLTPPVDPGIALINTVPSAIREVLENRAIPPGVKTINLAGEPLPQRLVDALYESTCVQRVVDLYGPTEATTYSTAVVRTRHGPQTIGRPIWNTQIYILDGHLQPVPIGVAGELYIGGDGLARGYWQQPALTAEKFIANPFGPPGSRLYRTGDRARYLPHGGIQYLGRLDHQVKIRGYRIELGEIESALRDQPGVAQAVVTVREDRADDKRLVAYWIPAEAGAPDDQALRAALKCRLPGHMIPAAFVRMEVFPLSPNGKIDRKALPAPAEQPRDPGHAGTAPQTPTQQGLARIWAGLLGVAESSVCLEDDFFRCGGHSLKLVQLVSRVRQEYQVELPLGSLFGRLALSDLAARIDSAKAGPGINDAIVARPERRCYPASAAQEQLWFIDQYTQRREVYTEPCLLTFRGAFDQAALQRAWHRLLERHVGLRTTFELKDDALVQVVHEPQRPELAIVDLSALTPAEREDRLGPALERDIRHRFDLACGPLWSVRIVRRAPDDHLVVLLLHHIIMDGWSLAILLREWSEFYAEEMGLPSERLAPVRAQYPDFSEWQREHLQDGRWHRQLAFWQETLCGPLPELHLPMARPRPPLSGFGGGAEYFDLDAELVARLEELAVQSGVTMFTVLLSAYAALLHRYSGQAELLVGVPMAGRGRLELENTVGMLMNTLPMRLDLGNDPAVVPWLQQVRNVALAAMDHQDVPFRQIVEAVAPRRQANVQPLFQAVFTYQNTPDLPTRFGDATVTMDYPNNGSSKFDLTLITEPTGRGIRCLLEYSSELFDARDMRQFADGYRTILGAFARQPHQLVSDLPLVDAADRRRLLAEYNDTCRDYPRERFVHELFEEQVCLSPTAVAVVHGRQRLTYAELDGRANQMAHHLRALGAQPGAMIGICITRSIDLIVGILGILKAGGAYVPLDPEYPSERLSFMLDDARAPLILTQSRLADRVRTARSIAVCVDSDAAAIAGCPQTRPPALGSADQPVYVMYTSGSTGRPKGVEVPHRAVVRLVKNTDYCSFGPDEVYLQLAPVCFDASTLEIWGSLLNGGRLVLAPEGPLALEELGGVLREHGVTTLWLTAGLFHAMVDNRVEDLGGLRQLLAGGDVLSAQHVRRCLETHPHLRLINGYGPTENTTFTCCHTMTSPAQVPDNVPIGRPIAHTQVYILDERGNLVPPGVPGELYTGGDGLARGYLNRPELTAERFVPNPFTAEPHARMYRTGDRARWLPDGTVEFLGRLDQQVKIRGFRIEPGEIEAALQDQAPVAQAVVVAREDAPGEKRLVAYWIAADGSQPDERELREGLRARLPDYMIPSAFVRMPMFPLSPNGKVDRLALPAPESNGPTDAAARVAPRDATEEKLVEIWEGLLSARPIGVHDNFFDLGGHSLMAVHLVARIHKQFGRQLPLGLLYSNATVAALAAALKLEAEPQAPGTLVELHVDEAKPPLFLLPGVGGHVFSFQKLARMLGADCSVYGLQAVGLDGREPMLDCIEDLARRYIREILATQPQGPYRLAGYSAGGLIAYEIAVQMERMGYRVAFLGMMDCYAPGYPRPLPARERLRLHWEYFRRLAVSEKLLYVKKRILRRSRRMARFFGFYTPVLPSSIKHLAPERMRECNRMLRKAMARYRPQPLNGAMTVFRAEDQPDWIAASLDDPVLGWSRWVRGPIECCEVPGSHMELFSPENLDAFANAFRRSLHSAAGKDCAEHTCPAAP